MSLRALVVDDEPPARARLARMLRALGVEVVGEAGDGETALTLVRVTAPDALFLDIDMPGLDGIALAAQHGWELPQLVFCTAHDQFAVRAFELNAADYLLKPVRAQRLEAAVHKVAARRGAPSTAAVAATLAAVAPQSTPRIISTTFGETRFFDANALTRLWSTDKYTAFLANGAEHLTEEALSSLEHRLRPSGFLRIHRAELVRLSAVKALRQTELGHEVLLDDGQHARVSRRLLSTVRAALGL